MAVGKGVDGGTTLASALRAQLQAKGWTQRDLAEYVDKHESTVSQWLSGKYTPREERVLVSRLAEFLVRSADEIRELLREGEKSGLAEPGLQRIRTVEELARVDALFPMDLLQLRDAAAWRERLRERGYEVDLEQRVVEGYVVGRLPGYRAPASMVLKTGADRSAGLATLEEAPERRGARERKRKGGRKKGERHEVPGRQRAVVYGQEGREEGTPDGALHDLPALRATIRELCSQLNDAFAHSEDERLSRKDLLRLLSSSAVQDGMVLSEAAGERLLDAMTAVRFLERAGADAYTRRWQLSASYLTNRMFGVVPHIAGLDFLLDGALLPPTQAGLSILVKGEPGVGKTTFSLQLASSLAGEGWGVVYLSAEEGPEMLEQRLSFAGYHGAPSTAGGSVMTWRNGEREARFTFSTMPTIERSKLPVVSPGSGWLVVSSVPDRKNALQSGKGSVLAQLTQIFAGMRQDGMRCCLVIDSINAVRPRAKRRTLEDLFNFARYCADMGIFVAEAGGPSEIPHSEHLADMVIALGSRARLEWVNERVIEIRKCRTQSHIRGQHMFSIHTDEGIRIYPSVQSKLSIWRRRIRRGAEPAPESWRLDENFDYDPVLRGDFVKGDAILLTGDPATHKFPVGLSFLAAGLQAHEAVPDPHLLLISLREDEVAIRRIIQNYDQLQPLLTALDNRGPGPRLHVMHFPPDYFSAERFLHWVERTLREMKRHEQRVSRVLFSTLSQLKYNSPMFEKEPLFVAALIELLKKERITSLFISVGGGQSQLLQVAPGDWLEDGGAPEAGETGERGSRRPPVVVSLGDGKGLEIGNVFDTIIFTSKRMRKAGGEEITLTVGHTAECNASRDPVPLRRPTIADANSAAGFSGLLQLDLRALDRGRPTRRPSGRAGGPDAGAAAARPAGTVRDSP
jgi:KaiC/GvpD/RAD55 family RecA-like ATPase/transcriptional regulator with XRE-family HTH domain